MSENVKPKLDDLICVKDAASKLGLTPRSLREISYRHGLRRFTFGGTPVVEGQSKIGRHTILFLRSEIEALIHPITPV